MIDFIYIEKCFDGKDMPFLGKCLFAAYYSNTDCYKYYLEGCRHIEIYWFAGLNKIKIKGSLLYYFQGHNFTYSNELFCQAVNYIGQEIECDLWQFEVKEFEYGVILQTIDSAKHYIANHTSKEPMKLIENSVPRHRGFFKWWEDSVVSLKMYDVSKNIVQKQTAEGKKILTDEGWNPASNYLKWEVHYKQPDVVFGNSTGLLLQNLVDPKYQEMFQHDLLNQYYRLQPSLNIVETSVHKVLKTIDIVFDEYINEMYKTNVNLKDIRKKLYTRINSVPGEVLNVADKKARKRQIKGLFDKIVLNPHSLWDLSEQLQS